MTSERARLARDLLLGEDVLHQTDDSPKTIAAAQAWATLAVADAIEKLAAAVEDTRASKP